MTSKVASAEAQPNVSSPSEKKWKQRKKLDLKVSHLFSAAKSFKSSKKVGLAPSASKDRHSVQGNSSIVSPSSKNTHTSTGTIPPPSRISPEKKKKVRPAIPKNASTLQHRGQVYERIGYYDKAAKCYKQSMAMHISEDDYEAAAEVYSFLQRISSKTTMDVSSIEPPVRKKETASATATAKEEEKEGAEHDSSTLDGFLHFPSNASKKISSTVRLTSDKISTVFQSDASSSESTSNNSTEVRNYKAEKKRNSAVVTFLIDTISLNRKTRSSSDSDLTSRRSAKVWAKEDPLVDGNDFNDGDVHSVTGAPSELKASSITMHDSLKMYCEGLAKMRSRHFKDAQKSFDQAIKNSKDTNAKELEPNIELAVMQEHHGDASVRLGQFETAEESYKQAVHIFQKRSPEHEEDLARTMMKRGDIQMSMENFAIAETYYTVSLRLWKKLLDEERGKDKKRDAIRLCHLLRNTGILHVKKGKYKEAEELFQEILSIQANNPEGDDGLAITIFVAVANNCIGNVQYKKGLYKEAITYNETSLELRKMILAKKECGEKEDFFSRDEMIGLHTNMGRAYFQLKRYEKAMRCFDKANRLLMVEKDNNELAIASNWILMGNVRFMEGEYEDAREFYNDAINAEKNILSDESQQILRIRHDIALTYCKEGKYDMGLEIMEDILKTEKRTTRVSGTNDLYVAKIYLDICAVHLKLGNGHKMVASLKSASELMKEHNLPENHSYMREKRALEVKVERYQAQITCVPP